MGGKDVVVLDNVSLDIEKGEFVCLLGPSGCGKSTLLNVLAGFEKLESGSVRIDGAEVVSPSPKRITIFQNYGLLPWRNVLKNVELGLEPGTVGSLIFFRISFCFVFMLSLPGRTPVQRRVHQAQFSASPAGSVSHPAESCLPVRPPPARGLRGGGVCVWEGQRGGLWPS